MKPSEEKTPGAREIIATVRDATVTYDGYQTRALARVQLEFRRGEIVCVLGPKGAGKSTLLKILSGRLRPTEGAVKVFGRSPRGGSTRARIGYLPGKADPDRSAGFFRRFFSNKKESPAARGLARLTQAFLGNRDLLVLDDPLEDLNAAEAMEAKSLVHEMAAKGKTIIFSSDALMEVKELCQRVVVLHEGRVEASGSLGELLSSANAIRFFPTVLPREMVDRALAVLRMEISQGTDAGPVTEAGTSENSPISRTDKANAEVARPEQLLKPLTRPAETGASMERPVNASDQIDHEKLEGLTKNQNPGGGGR